MRKSVLLIAAMLCAGGIFTACVAEETVGNEAIMNETAAETVMTETSSKTENGGAEKIVTETEGDRVIVRGQSEKPAKPELLVYVDGYSNTTAYIVNNFAADHPEIKVNIEKYTDMGIPNSIRKSKRICVREPVLTLFWSTTAPSARSKISRRW